MKLFTVYLGTGSNVGNRFGNLQDALWQINKHLGAVVKQSSVYQTAAWGITDQDPFLNQVLQIETPFSPEVLMKKILIVERNMGRIRKEKWGPRIIDIDILMFENWKINSDHLQVPHPQMHLRKFVLMPLAEISGKLVHPVLNKSILQLEQLCEDPLEVIKYY